MVYNLFLVESPLVTRREFREFSRDERTRFGEAVRQVADTIVDENEDPDTSQYDLFVRMHQLLGAPGAHQGPAFLPWHRQFLFMFESALQEIDPEVSIPYWDSALDQPLPVVTDSIFWADDNMGNTEGNVTTGKDLNMFQ